MNSPIRSGPISAHRKRSVGRERTVKILKMIALGTLIIAVGAAPSPHAVSQLLRALILGDTSENRRYAFRKIREMRGRGLLEKQGVKFAVSYKGSRILSESEIHNLRIPRPARWDQKWRLIMFDIPLSESSARKALNIILLGMGLVQYQQSVLVYPYPVKETALHVCRFYKIGRYVSFASTDDLDGSDKLRKIFKLG